MNTKPFFWESIGNLKTSQNLSSYIGVSYKFILKTIKNLNESPESFNIGNARDCQILLTNTKPLFSGNVTIFETLQ